jgi:acyl-ACP thioesterase
MSGVQLDEMLEPPSQGRVFRHGRIASLGDCAPSGRVRLDALARWLQDVAYEDVVDAGVAAHAVWVVRRARMRIVRFPRFGERVELATFCSGIGRAWAQRRTSVKRLGESASDVETVSLWVHLDPSSWHPCPFTPEEIAVYGETAGERRVSHRLRHPAPPADARRSTWTFRHSECDVAQHVNNAAYWTVLDEEMLAAPDPEQLDVEMEWRNPAQPAEKVVLGQGERRWITGQDGEAHASILIASRR